MKGTWGDSVSGDTHGFRLWPMLWRHRGGTTDDLAVAELQYHGLRAEFVQNRLDLIRSEAHLRHLVAGRRWAIEHLAIGPDEARVPDPLRPQGNSEVALLQPDIVSSY